MRIRIERNLCQGHGRCNAVDPDLYPLDEDGFIAVVHVDVPPGSEEAALKGLNSCPERAISLEK